MEAVETCAWGVALPSVNANKAYPAYFVIGSDYCTSKSARDTSAGRRLSVRRGRPGLTVNTAGLIAVGFPAANSLSLIFVRIGYSLNGLPYTIPDSMPGSLDCAASGLQPPGLFRRHHLRPAL